MKERANFFLRFCDRFIGIPLVLFLSLFKKKRKWPKSIQRVAFLKTAGIGDAVLLSAVIADFKTAFPKVEVTFFSGMSNKESALLIPDIKVIALPMTRPLFALLKIRKASFDLWIDCDPWPRITALFSFFSKSSCTIGFKTVGQYRHFLHDYLINHSFNCHELENYRKLIRPLGIEPTKIPSLNISVSKENQCKVALHLFAAGSRAESNRWPNENWKALIRFLLQKNIHVILTGSQKDFKNLQEFVLDRRILNWAGKCTLVETAKILKTCVCLVSVDTGIMHLAAALDMPVIALHGPMPPTRWGGVGKKVISLTPDLDYNALIQLEYKSMRKMKNCMEAISVEKVKNTLLKVLDEARENESIDFGWGQRNKALASFEKEIS